MLSSKWEKLQSHNKRTILIALCLVFSALIYLSIAGIIYFLGTSDLMPSISIQKGTSSQVLVKTVFYILGASLIIIVFLIRQSLLSLEKLGVKMQSLSKDDNGEFTKDAINEIGKFMLRRGIITLTICSYSALLGLVAFFITLDINISIILGGISIISMAIYWPSFTKWQEDLDYIISIDNSQ